MTKHIQPSTYKPKECLTCLEQFTPTGACQVRCGSYRDSSGCSYKYYLLKHKQDYYTRRSQASQEEILEVNKKGRMQRLRLKTELYNHYGRVCRCCGETNQGFLTLDHINNDGYKERREGKYKNTGQSFYSWLKKNGFPDHIQVLCYNCNCGKKVNGGICPHASLAG